MAWLMVITLYIFGLYISGGGAAIQRNREKGAYLGEIQSHEHGVGGQVWAVDEKTLFIEKFTYDGVGPDVFFWVGNSSQPQPTGQLVKYPLTDGYSRKPVRLSAFRGEDVLVHLPPGTKVTDLTYLSVWCRRFTVNFGHVIFPKIVDLPRKRVLKEFERRAHGVRSGNITILDARTFYIPNLHYDGRGPDAFFWVGKGSVPDHHGTKIPNEKGSYEVLRRYEGEDIEIQLPENKTMYDIDYLSIWCVQYRHNFGHVTIPNPETMWLPPSLGQIRIKPEDVARAYGVEVEQDQEQSFGYLPDPTYDDNTDKAVVYLPAEDELQHLTPDNQAQNSHATQPLDPTSTASTSNLNSITTTFLVFLSMSGLFLVY